MLVTKLPDTFILQLFSYLNKIDLIILKRTCKRFNSLMKNVSTDFVDAGDADIMVRSKKGIVYSMKYRISEWILQRYGEPNQYLEMPKIQDYKYNSTFIIDDKFVNILYSYGQYCLAYDFNPKKEKLPMIGNIEEETMSSLFETEYSEEHLDDIFINKGPKILQGGNRSFSIKDYYIKFFGQNLRINISKISNDLEVFEDYFDDLQTDNYGRIYLLVGGRLYIL